MLSEIHWSTNRNFSLGHPVEKVKNYISRIEIMEQSKKKFFNLILDTLGHFYNVIHRYLSLAA